MCVCQARTIFGTECMICKVLNKHCAALLTNSNAMILGRMRCNAAALSRTISLLRSWMMWDEHVSTMLTWARGFKSHLLRIPSATAWTRTKPLIGMFGCAIETATTLRACDILKGHDEPPFVVSCRRVLPALRRLSDALIIPQRHQ